MDFHVVYERIIAKHDPKEIPAFAELNTNAFLSAINAPRTVTLASAPILPFFPHLFHGGVIIAFYGWSCNSKEVSDTIVRYEVVQNCFNLFFCFYVFTMRRQGRAARGA
jgi:hypothetical protein